MQLKKLELYGFKSFSDKTRVEFDKGITAIVGPNGSGKSNIVDAIQWVLGEQSVKNLRGSKMEDVVFKGSDKRKANGFAEVTLTLDNSANFLCRGAGFPQALSFRGKRLYDQRCGMPSEGHHQSVYGLRNWKVRIFHYWTRPRVRIPQHHAGGSPVHI